MSAFIIYIALVADHSSLSFIEPYTNAQLKFLSGLWPERRAGWIFG